MATTMSTTDPVTAVPKGKYGQLGIYHQYYIPNAAQAKMCQVTALFKSSSVLVVIFSNMESELAAANLCNL
jgi:hypothetical protein